MSEFQIIRRLRRQHTTEFKRQIVALCKPGISASAVALAHGVNTNLLRRWIKEYSEAPSMQTSQAPGKLIPVQVDMPTPAPSSEFIEIDIQRNGLHIGIRWPGSQAGVCSQWLGAMVK